MKDLWMNSVTIRWKCTSVLVAVLSTICNLHFPFNIFNPSDPPNVDIQFYFKILFRFRNFSKKKINKTKINFNKAPLQQFQILLRNIFSQNNSPKNRISATKIKTLKNELTLKIKKIYFSLDFLLKKTTNAFFNWHCFFKKKRNSPNQTNASKLECWKELRREVSGFRLFLLQRQKTNSIFRLSAPGMAATSKENKRKWNHHRKWTQ